MAKAKKAIKQRWYVTLDPFEVCIQTTKPRAVCRVEEAKSFAEAREKALEFLYGLALDCAKRAGCIRICRLRQFAKRCWRSFGVCEDWTGDPIRESQRVTRHIVPLSSLGLRLSCWHGLGSDSR